MTISLALYQPDIPQNTGTLMRLGACLDVHLHIIHPTGFAFSSKHLKRAGMDYIAASQFTEHSSFEAFNTWRADEGKRLVLLTTKTETSAYALKFTPDDILMVGRESAGVPENVAKSADCRIRIPMAPDQRSINVAIAAAIVLGEAKRQTDGFQTLS